MHRAGPQHPARFGHGNIGGVARDGEIARRFCNELVAATGAAEEITGAGVLGAMWGPRDDGHPADGVTHRSLPRGWRMFLFSERGLSRSHQGLSFADGFPALVYGARFSGTS